MPSTTPMLSNLAAHLSPFTMIGQKIAGNCSTYSIVYDTSIKHVMTYGYRQSCWQSLSANQPSVNPVLLVLPISFSRDMPVSTCQSHSCSPLSLLEIGFLIQRHALSGGAGCKIRRSAVCRQLSIRQSARQLLLAF